MSFRIFLCKAIFVVFIACRFGDAPAAPMKGPSYVHTLYLVRHGAYDTKIETDPKVGGGLTPLGIAQARLIASRLRGLPVHFDSITSSTMTRARETAAVIHESLAGVPLGESPLLSECTPPAMRSFQDETEESQARCAAQLDQAFAERFQPATKSDASELLVCRGNVIRYLVTKALGVDTRAWLSMSVANTSLTVIQVTAAGKYRVLSVGDIGHVPPNMQSGTSDTTPELSTSGLPK